MQPGRSLAPRWRWFVALMGLAIGLAEIGARASVPAYSDVDAVLRRHCLDCHAVQEPEAGLVLETYATLLQGGKSGPVVRAGDAAGSSLWVSVEAGLLRDGQRKRMPPGKREKLKPEETALLKRWIDGGAPGPVAAPGTATVLREVTVPRIDPVVPPARAIRAIAGSVGFPGIALGRPGEVELVAISNRTELRRLGPVRGDVAALAFSADGTLLVAGSGQPGRFGEATVWNPTTGQAMHTLSGHTDALYAVALAADGKTVATGGYDQKIRLWDVATGALRHTLSAHNAGVFALAFRPDGAVLASASWDRTVKLWQAASGKRIETFSQPQKELHALAWSPNGRRLVAAGADNRIRLWEISESAAETTNPLLASRFAHDGTILALAWSPDGTSLASSADERSIKIWDPETLTERRTLSGQSDLAPALAYVDGGSKLAVGRLDGTWDLYDPKTGAIVAAPPPAPPPAPVLQRADPRGVIRGKPTVVTLTGSHLAGVTNFQAAQPELRLALLSVTSGVARVLVEPGLGLGPGPYEISALGPGGSGGKIRLFVDTLPSLAEERATNVLDQTLTLWGALRTSGEVDEFQFAVRSNQWFVAELSARAVDSKLLNGRVSIVDDSGRTLAAAGGFGGSDPVVAYRFSQDAVARVRITDQLLAASDDHFYRLSAGELAIATGVFPLVVPTNAESSVLVTGYHLSPESAEGRVPASPAGTVVGVGLRDTHLKRARTLSVMAVPGARAIEQEPNDRPGEANAFAWPGAVSGRIGRPGDADWFRIAARAGQRLIVETAAARLGTPVDTQVEICDRHGRRVPRLRLQAVRNTAINFRGVDAVNPGLRLDHYEEMELNEYLYLNGDVMRLFRMPQGPDSDLLMFTSAGKRRAYFDTTAVGHALDETGFIVQPLAADAAPAPNGLPVFTLHFENDDDSLRQLGADSRLAFDPPADGDFWIRVTDAQGHGGDEFAYALLVREARPDFRLSVVGTDPTVPRGSGQSFTVTAERIDGFDGEIQIDVSDVPPGFHVSNPLVIEAGHDQAKGTLFAGPDARLPDGTNHVRVRLMARAMIGGQAVTHPAGNLGTVRLGPAPKLYVRLTTESLSATNGSSRGADREEPMEIVIEPGRTVPAWLSVQRAGHRDIVTFFAENLPHGVIVADIGLNGVLIPKDESERQIFLSADRWVRPQERWFYLIEQQAGRQTSRPVRLKVAAPVRAAGEMKRP